MSRHTIPKRPDRSFLYGLFVGIFGYLIVSITVNLISSNNKATSLPGANFLWLFSTARRNLSAVAINPTISRKPPLRAFKENLPSLLHNFKLDYNLSQNQQESKQSNSNSVNSAISSLQLSSSSSSAKFTREKCYSKYGDRKFMNHEQKKLPPMLYTFPGSGNTWGRLLIEHTTGVFTGSVYNDRTLLDVLPGEFTCDWTVSVIKVHPHTHSFSELDSGNFNSDDNKCKRGNVRKFQKALFLIRNPFDAIWSEYQRRVTQSHVIGIARKRFDWPRWQANAASLSVAYHEMITKHYAGFERALGVQNVLYLRYERLKDKSTRVDELATLGDFLKLPVSRERLQCAFMLSESTQAHRTLDDSDMTKELAYTRPLACRMWNLFGAYIERFNYTVWGGYNCSGVPPIKNVNVGARGEYDNLWVKSGQPLLDFGGHDEFDKIYNGKRGSGKEGRQSGIQTQIGDQPRPNSQGIGQGRGKVRGQVGHGQKRERDRLGNNRVRTRDVADQGQQRALPQRPIISADRYEHLPISSATSGMSLDQAMTVPGVGGVGADKPAWA